MIAVIKEENGSETDFTAPYDCILIELPISTEDELAANSQIAMVMGTDGFTMGIAVDELDISTVKVCLLYTSSRRALIPLYFWGLSKI